VTESGAPRAKDEQAQADGTAQVAPPGSTRAWRRLLPPLVLAALALTLTLPGIDQGGFRHSDASRHAMDGVFVHDFVHDLPRSAANPIDYTLGYYAQYPALGIILYYPPFFALVEAVFFAVFGISPFTARLTVVFFAAAAAVGGYRLLKSLFDPRVAFVAVALFLSLPLVVFWSRQTMLEMPTTAMVLASIWFFHRYIDLDRRRSALWTGVFVVLAVMTKQPALFVLPAFALYALARRKWGIFRHWQLYAALALIAAVLVPYFFLTFRYARYLTATVFTPASAAGGAKAASELLGRFASVITSWDQALGPWLLWPCLACGLVCVVWEIARPRWSGTHLLALLVACYLVQSALLGARVGRYVFIILPVLMTFPPLLLARLDLLRRAPVLAAACAGVAVAAVVSFLQPINVMSGHQQAIAELVRRNGGNKLVLFEGYWDGDAVFFARQADPKRRLYVLRGSKLLYSYASFPGSHQVVRVQNHQDVRDLIRSCGIQAVAVESRDVYADNKNSGDPLIQVRRMLREVLQDTERFELIATSRIHTRADRGDGADRLDGADVLVYAVRDPIQPQADDLIIPMTGLQLAIRVPLKSNSPPTLVKLPLKDGP